MAAELKSSEQLALAMDESTPEEVLYSLWEQTRSIKIRKAVARNPNAGAKVLRQAARLYLEDVLENPGFSMLALFSDGHWVKTVGDVYANPEEQVHAKGVFYGGRTTDTDRDLFRWAALLSPKLTPDVLEMTISAISAEKLGRVLKNPKAVAQIKTVFVTALKNSSTVWPFSLGTLLLLHKKDLIDNDYLFEGLSHCGIAGASCSKRDFSAFLNKLTANYIASKKTRP